MAYEKEVPCRFCDRLISKAELECPFCRKKQYDLSEINTLLEKNQKSMKHWTTWSWDS